MKFGQRHFVLSNLEMLSVLIIIKMVPPQMSGLRWTVCRMWLRDILKFILSKEDERKIQHKYLEFLKKHFFFVHLNSRDGMFRVPYLLMGIGFISQNEEWCFWRERIIKKMELGKQIADYSQSLGQTHNKTTCKLLKTCALYKIMTCISISYDYQAWQPIFETDLNLSLTIF